MKEKKFITNRLAGALAAALFTITGSGAWGADAPAAASAGFDRVPYLEVHGTVQGVPPGPPAPGNPVIFSSRTLLVFKDGTTVSSVVLNEIPGSQPFSARLVETVAAPDTLAALVGAASTNRIGFQSGDCDVDGIFSGPYDYQITWYGRQSRLNSFRLSSSFFPARCPDETRALVLAILDFENKIVAQGQ